MRIFRFFFSTKFLLLAFTYTLLSGCAISNEGATDYRYIHHAKPNDRKVPIIKGKYIKPKNSQHAINPGDALVISLKQVFINDFVEFNNPLRWFRNEPTNGEVAVIVNAFEIGKGETTNFGPNGKENARVVYFSDDVWEGQFLNLSNLSTIYGPIAYDGGPFILDLYVVEMDTPGEQLRQLLSNLAAIGSTFYPPAAPIAGPMAQLAGTLITDDQDDRAYHYTAELKLKGGDPELNTGILQTGDYVFIREEDRHTTTNWNNLGFDERNGRIIYSKKMNGKSDCGDRINQGDYPSHCYYRDNSYIVVEVNTAISALQNDTNQMLFSQLSTQVFNNSAPIFEAALPEQVLNDLGEEIKKTRSADSINKQLRILASKTNSAVENRVALDRFLHLWTLKDEESAETLKIVHELNEIDRDRIEDRLAKIVSECKEDSNDVMSIMGKLRDRQKFTPLASENSDAIVALSCLDEAHE